MANVKKIGNKCESLLLDMLKEKNYWCHLFASKDSGQPCDVIALKGDKHYLIDVKHCDTNVFYYSRIESNQHNCFKYAMECYINHRNLGFAIYCEETKKFYWLNYALINDLKDAKKVMVTALPELESIL